MNPGLGNIAAEGQGQPQPVPSGAQFHVPNIMLEQDKARRSGEMAANNEAILNQGRIEGAQAQALAQAEQDRVKAVIMQNMAKQQAYEQMLLQQQSQPQGLGQLA